MRKSDVGWQHGYSNGSYTLIQNKYILGVQSNMTNWTGRIVFHNEDEALKFYEIISDNPSIIEYMKWETTT